MMKKDFENNYVRTGYGWVHGIHDDFGNHVFKGIPFALPPVGNLRFKDPQPPLNWQGVRETDHFGPEAVQVYGGYDGGEEDSHEEYSSEDCLYLNIWSPAKSAKEKLPVFVWIHGGAFMGGSGSGFLYRGGNLAQRGIVVVTINYRMGILGFMSHSSFTRHGNFAIADQTMALKWVKENIAYFGGNPDRITVGGQSAGSCSIGFLLNSPYTQGLFHQVIMESGPMYGSLVGEQKSAEEMDVMGVDFVDKYLDGDISRLYSSDALELIKMGIEYAVNSGEGLVWRPCVDGDIARKSLRELYQENQNRQIDILAGCTEYEFISDYRPEEIKKGISKEEFEALVGAIKDETSNYPVIKEEISYTTREESLYQYSKLKAALMLEDVKDMAEANARGGNKTYIYQFRKHTSDPENLYRAPHSAELPYLFGLVGYGGAFPWFPNPWKADDFRVMNEVQTLWSDFIKGKKLIAPGGKEWKPWAEHQVLIIK